MQPVYFETVVDLFQAFLPIVTGWMRAIWCVSDVLLARTDSEHNKGDRTENHVDANDNPPVTASKLVPDMGPELVG